MTFPSIGDRTTVDARELAALLVEALHMEDVDAAQLDLTAPLFDGGLDLDSLDLLEISLVVQQHYGVKLMAEHPDNEKIFRSMESLAAHIGSARTQS